MYTSKEYITIDKFLPCYNIIIYKNNKKIYHYKSFEFEKLETLKEKARHQNKQHINNNKLAILKNNNQYITLKYYNHFNNIVENYQAYKQLLSQLLKKDITILVETKNSKKEYKNNYKIIYLK